MLRLSVALLVALAVCGPARAQTQDKPPLPELLQRAGAATSRGTPDLTGLDSSPTRDQQLPFFRAVMAAPLEAPYRAGLLADSLRAAAGSPRELIGWAGALSGARLQRPVDFGMASIEAKLRAAPDPLAAGLAWMSSTKAGAGWVPVLPDQAQLPNPLRYELARVLAAMSQSHQFLQRAFERFPPGVTPQLLRRQALDDQLTQFETPDFRQLLSLVEREAVVAGMLDLVGAVDRLQNFVKKEALPSVSWSLQTPFGWVVVDTTGRNNHHRLKDALLVLDVGGDDDYEFLAKSDTHAISVLVDHGGNDTYRTTAPGADPSSATLGYGILWDTEGDDRYVGTQQAQASALFGAALLVDGGGSNRFIASSRSQAHAVGGIAVLVSSSGDDDEYIAQTYSQATGGPGGVALLVDTGGNDRYTLNNVPLVRPSPQLPARNTSMGQGAGYGMRGAFFDGRSTSGGIGILLDMAGNDRYEAQVFAQGAGYYEGLGMLLDDGGNDRFDAAWYAMGASAHYAAGILQKRGAGNDVYRSTHEMVLGTGNDFSVGVFVDEGGDDEYNIGDLSMGVAYANGTGIFVDGRGNDRYNVASATCRALGAAFMHAWGNARETLPGLGLFMDLGGVDSYPAHCARAGNNKFWAGPRVWPLLELRSEAAAGVDGEWPLPFSPRLLTRPVPPAGGTN